jgi:hypothetical protein
LVRGARRDRDRAALTRQGQRDFAADAAAGAGDERDGLCGGKGHGLSTQKRKSIGRLVDWLSRDGSVKQRTRGLLLLLLLGGGGLELDDEAAQPASATRKSESSVSIRTGRFMRPFYLGIRYI